MEAVGFAFVTKARPSGLRQIALIADINDENTLDDGIISVSVFKNVSGRPIFARAG
jgi:hypothetical protein